MQLFPEQKTFHRMQRKNPETETLLIILLRESCGSEKIAPDKISAVTDCCWSYRLLILSTQQGARYSSRETIAHETVT